MYEDGLVMSLQSSKSNLLFLHRYKVEKPKEHCYWHYFSLSSSIKMWHEAQSVSLSNDTWLSLSWVQINAAHRSWWVHANLHHKPLL